MNSFFRPRSDKYGINHSFLVGLLLLATIVCPPSALAQGALETPLRQELLTLLTNEISGQVAFNNVVKLAGGLAHESPELFVP